MRMEEDRKEIRNSEGKRIFELVWKNDKVYLETYHKGKRTQIPLLDELYKVYKALKPEERVEMLEYVNGLAQRELAIAY